MVSIVIANIQRGQRAGRVDAAGATDSPQFDREIMTKSVPRCQFTLVVTVERAAAEIASGQVRRSPVSRATHRDNEVVSANPNTFCFPSMAALVARGRLSRRDAGAPRGSLSSRGRASSTRSTATQSRATRSNPSSCILPASIAAKGFPAVESDDVPHRALREPAL